ncbi:MAG: glycosyltransferase family 4 protein [Chitinophagaceae bacterium]|nr:glycosyltransferase family 4 protein [Chitinophagaceae bacterium]
MKVGIVHTNYIKKGGEDVVVEQETIQLRDRNIDTSVLLFQNPKGKAAQITGMLSSLFNVASWKRMNKWMEQEKPDIIHIHNWHFSASPSVIMAASRKGIPVVHTLHNFRLLCPSGLLLHNNKLFLDSLKGPFPWQAVFKKVYHDSFFQTFWLSLTVWLHKNMGTFKNIDRFIVLTGNAKKIFTSSSFPMDESKIDIKPNFIQDIQLSPVERGNNFLFIGRLAPEKGIDILLEAFDGTDFELTIIGEGPLEHLVEKAMQKNPKIRYLGFQARPAILTELQKCSAMVFPSIWYEGNPLVIIEALACGTPIISSRMGAMETMIRDGYNGMHYDPESVEDFRNKLKTWQGMYATERNIMYVNARESYVTTYTAEKNIEQLLLIYKSVINEKSRLT